MAARLTAYLVVAIVAGTLIAGLIVGAQRDDNEGPVDLIVQNANVYTADGRGTLAEAVAVRGNQILRVGSTREIARLQQRQTIVIDARGGTVLPGLHDSHLRFARTPFGTGAIDLTGAATISEVLARVSAWSTAHPDRPWVIGRGWAPELFRAATPWRQLLDSVVADRPILLLGVDGSTALTNSAGLQRAGLGRAAPDVEGGTVPREVRTAEPSGVLRGSATDRAIGQMPPLTPDERMEALRGALTEANAAGITSAQSLDDSPEWLETYDTLRRAGDLTVRVSSAIPVEGPITERDLPRLEQATHRYPDDPLFKAGALSIRLDGPVSSRLAALLTPYAGATDPPGASGDVLFERDDLNRTVRIADAAGWQIILHASGDRAARIALDAYEHAIRSNPVPPRGRRHRLEAVTLMSEEDLARLAPLGVAAAMQPSRSTVLEPLTRALGPQRAARAFPFSRLAGETRLVFGSGWPASPMDPLAGLRAATAPIPPPARRGRAPATAHLDLMQAIDGYTSAAAWASFDDQRKGAIVPGMLADLVVLSEDIFATDPEVAAAAAVEFTVFDGRVVYRRTAPSETE